MHKSTYEVCRCWSLSLTFFIRSFSVGHSLMGIMWIGGVCLSSVFEFPSLFGVGLAGSLFFVVSYQILAWLVVIRLLMIYVNSSIVLNDYTVGILNSFSCFSSSVRYSVQVFSTSISARFNIIFQVFKYDTMYCSSSNFFLSIRFSFSYHVKPSLVGDLWTWLVLSNSLIPSFSLGILGSSVTDPPSARQESRTHFLPMFRRHSFSTFICLRISDTILGLTTAVLHAKSGICRCFWNYFIKI